VTAPAGGARDRASARPELRPDKATCPICRTVILHPITAELAAIADFAAACLADCPDCGGSGRQALGEGVVTHEMALDACEPSMEGQSTGIEYGPCPRCGGGGKVRRAPEAAAPRAGTDEDDGELEEGQCATCGAKKPYACSPDCDCERCQDPEGYAVDGGWSRPRRATTRRDRDV
jgi:hypothetical protein